MKSPNPRIAIVRLSALGDIINTAVVLQIIRKHYPDALIDWYVEEAFAPVLAGHPDLHDVIPVPLKRMKKSKGISLLLSTVKKLRNSPSYDMVVDAQGLLKSAIVAALLPGPVHGFDRRSAREGAAAWFYDTTSAVAYDENVVRRNVRVVTDALRIPYDEGEILNKRPVFALGEQPPIIREGGKAVACVIGASWPSKCYPKERFAQVCAALSHPCYLIWGSEKEREDAQWIAEHASNAVVVPKMSLAELVNFVAHCDLLIGNDTGPTHIAWAMNKASITLFGPTNERMIYPGDRNAWIKSPSAVNILKIDRNDFSIGQIDPQEVIRKAKELL